MNTIQNTFFCWALCSIGFGVFDVRQSTTVLAWLPTMSLQRRLSTLNARNDQQQEQLQQTVVKSSTKRSQKLMYDFMEEPMRTTVGDAITSTSNVLKISSSTNEDVFNHIRCIVSAADGRKADNIVVLNVRNISTLCSYMIILTGNSRPQNQAIASTIDKDMKDYYDQITIGKGIPEGSAESGWIILDYGDIMVHVMTPKSRLYYNVEGQWKDKGGVSMDISHLVVPNQVIDNNKQQMELQSNDDSFMKLNSDDYVETDPFWS